MTEVVASSEIERIVGCKRHPIYHFGRAISAEQTLYILHSQTCLGMRDDLRECPYSVALDQGIDIESDWGLMQDRPVLLEIDEYMCLVPVEFDWRYSM